ncbi:hypothetical protein D1BOALGB6SA_4020 [Olavius sp. associated proteobacterium Delta 1]|nr:hypothetical protein D1BOALGB6SA_4020 [Olavius sp. associated proteobacterium Delta 1]
MTINRDEQIEKLVEDIASIKTVIMQNKPAMRQLLLPLPFRRFLLIAGLIIIVYSVLIYFLIAKFGSYAAISGIYKNIFYGLLILTWLALVFMKYSTWLRTLKKIDGQYTLRRAFKEFLTQKVIHVFLPITLVMVFLVIYLVYYDAYRFIVPAASIGSGLIYNFLGSMTDIKQYLITGYWFLITGTLIITFSAIPIPIALAVSIGCGHILLAAISHREE